MRAVVPALVGAMLLAACAGTAKGPPQTYRVLVDGHGTDAPVAFSAFFPKVVRVHPGDTVVFTSRYSGLPHTVATGRAVDKGLIQLSELAANNPAALDAGPPPAYAALPRLLAAGSGDVHQSAAQPCVVGSGDLPSGDACKDQSLPQYDGSQQLVTSGWLGPDSSWSLHFAPSTKPGTYRFLCQVHGPDMSGSVQVVPHSAKVKDPAAVEAEGVAAREAVLQRVQPGLGPLAGATSAHALAGSGDPSSPDAVITAFAPKDVKVRVGGTVAWTVIGTHSIAFNAPPTAVGLRRTGPGNEVHLSQAAELPAGGHGAGPGVPQPPPVINGGRWNGRGFRSSGLVFGAPPPHTTEFRLTFTRAGHYSFVCTVHPGMAGTVTVR